MEVRSKVKGFPKHVCEGPQIHNLEVDLIGKGGKQSRQKGQITLCHLGSQVYHQEFLLFQSSSSLLSSTTLIILIIICCSYWQHVSHWPEVGSHVPPEPKRQPVQPRSDSELERVCRWNKRSPHLDTLLQSLPCNMRVLFVLTKHLYKHAHLQL